MIFSVIPCSLLLSQQLQQQAQRSIETQATQFMQTMSAVRQYTQEQILPLFTAQTQDAQQFIPETVPAYAVEQIFAALQHNAPEQPFSYKEAAPNPTNLRHKADEFEIQLINQFRQDPATQRISGFQDRPEGRVFYLAQPVVMRDPSCLQCHSRPAIAPPSLISTYGSQNGFNWHLNDVVAAQIVSVPVDVISASAHPSFWQVILVVLGMFGILLILLAILLQKVVVQRIRRLSRTAQAISLGETQVTFEEISEDEIGKLAIALQRMKHSLEIALNILNPST
ncbi:MAG: DUF3365 domain-containing protein [Oculatellaceae cyanobacterium Prado106]|nr:DUF3365 domain-containing protein [Oculatellaceae cyanobacterium Prado106]